jgi:hypothetical protein
MENSLGGGFEESNLKAASIKLQAASQCAVSDVVPDKSIDSPANVIIVTRKARTRRLEA